MRPGEFWGLAPVELFEWIEARAENQSDLSWVDAWRTALLSRVKRLPASPAKLIEQSRPKKPETAAEMMAKAKAFTGTYRPPKKRER